MRELVALLSFLTRLPAGRHELMEAASGFYMVPIVGAIEGLLIALPLAALLKIGVDPLLVASVYLILYVAVTGGMHVDGLADYVDVVASQRRGLDAVKIMKDPCRGSFALLAIVLIAVISLASVASMAALPLYAFIATMTMTHVIAAESMFVTAGLGGEEPYNGLARYFLKEARKPSTISRSLAIIVVVTAAVAIAGQRLISILVAIAMGFLVSYVVAVDAKRRLGFVNGDILGFTYEISRAACLLVFALI